MSSWDNCGIYIDLGEFTNVVACSETRKRESYQEAPKLGIMKQVAFAFSPNTEIEKCKCKKKT